MKTINCSEFEERLDEWVSGTLPDFERESMDNHAHECQDCHALATASRAIISAARKDPLELPGEGYFLELRGQMEDRLKREGVLRSWPQRLLHPTRRSSNTLRGRIAHGLDTLRSWVAGTSAYTADAQMAHQQRDSTGEFPADMEELENSSWEHNRYREQLYKVTDDRKKNSDKKR